LPEHNKMQFRRLKGASRIFRRLMDLISNIVPNPIDFLEGILFDSYSLCPTYPLRGWVLLLDFIATGTVPTWATDWNNSPTIAHQLSHLFVDEENISSRVIASYFYFSYRCPCNFQVDKWRVVPAAPMVDSVDLQANPCQVLGSRRLGKAACYRRSFFIGLLDDWHGVVST
jgi:hypothetical protein